MAPYFDKALSLARAFASKTAGSSGEDVVFRAVRDVIDQTAADREHIQKLRDFYGGDHIRGTGLNNGVMYIPSWPDETDAEKSARADSMETVTRNRIREGVHTQSDALYASSHNKGVYRKITWPDSMSGADAEVFGSIVDRSWKRSNIDLFMWQAQTIIGSEGSCVVMLQWLDGSKRRLSRFSSTNRKDHRESGLVWLEILDNLQTIVLPHTVETTEVGAIIRWYERPIPGGVFEAGAVVEPGQPNTVTEYITDDLWLRWVGNQLEEHSWGTENRYGDVRSLFVLGKNAGGVSDSEDALNGQTLLAEFIYNGWEVHRSSAFAERLYRGYDPPTRKGKDGTPVLIRGPNIAHVAQDPNADIVIAKVPTSIDEVGTSEDRIHSMIDEALGVSITDRSSGGDLGQLRSGPGISKLLGKSERRRRRKILSAAKFERDLFVSMANVADFHAFGGQHEQAIIAARIDVVFPDDGFTLDPYTESQKDQIELEAGTKSREELVRAKHPSLTDEEIQAIIKDIEAGIEVGGNGKKPDPNAISRSIAQGQ